MTLATLLERVDHLEEGLIDTDESAKEHFFSTQDALRDMRQDVTMLAPLPGKVDMLAAEGHDLACLYVATATRERILLDGEITALTEEIAHLKARLESAWAQEIQKRQDYLERRAQHRWPMRVILWLKDCFITGSSCISPEEDRLVATLRQNIADFEAALAAIRPLCTALQEIEVQLTTPAISTHEIIELLTTIQPLLLNARRQIGYLRTYINQTRFDSLEERVDGHDMSLWAIQNNVAAMAARERLQMLITGIHVCFSIYHYFSQAQAVQHAVETGTAGLARREEVAALETQLSEKLAALRTANSEELARIARELSTKLAEKASSEEVATGAKQLFEKIAATSKASEEELTKLFFVKLAEAGEANNDALTKFVLAKIAEVRTAQERALAASARKFYEALTADKVCPAELQDIVAYVQEFAHNDATKMIGVLKDTAFKSKPQIVKLGAASPTSVLQELECRSWLARLGGYLTGASSQCPPPG
jgi:hypothetical protein